MSDASMPHCERCKEPEYACTCYCTNCGVLIQEGRQEGGCIECCPGRDADEFDEWAATEVDEWEDVREMDE